MKNGKIVLPLYKILYAICFIVLLAFVRGISYTYEIGVAIDPNISLLAVIFFSDTLEAEYREKRWEIFSLLPEKSRIRTIRQRIGIQWGYLWLLSVIGYWIFYWQNPRMDGTSTFFLYGIYLFAVGASILFWGILSMTIVNKTGKLVPGIGITVLLWLLINSKGGEQILGNFSVFAFGFRDIKAASDFSWAIGKAVAIVIALFLLLWKGSFHFRMKKA